MNKLWTRNFTFMVLGNLFMAMAFYFLIPVLPIYITDVMKVSKGEVGLVFATYTLAALIIRPLTGVALDTLGRKWIYLISMFFFSMLFGSYIFANTIFLLILVRLAHGFVWGVNTTAGSTIIVDFVPAERRGEGIGFYGLSMGIAMALAPFLAMKITGENNYHALFISAFVFAVVSFILVVFIRFPKFKKHENHSGIKLENFFTMKATPASLNILFIMIPYGAVITFISIFAKENHLPNPGSFFLIFAIGLTVSRILSGKIFDRKGPKNILTLGLILLTLSFPSLAFFVTKFGFLVSSLIMGAGFGITFPIFQAMINNILKPQERGAGNSTYLTAIDIGIGSGSVLIGLVSQSIGLQNAFYVCGGISLLSLIFFRFRAFPHYTFHLNNKA